MAFSEYLNFIGEFGKLYVQECPGREINLMRTFRAKLANFLNFNVVHDSAHNKTSILEHLDLIHDVTFWFAISYSFIMVVTALARYVFHSKNANMTITGMYCIT